MYERHNERSFFGEFIKWFLIWNIISLLLKGIIFLIKITFIALKHIICLICIGIEKICPILKEKVDNLRSKYNMSFGIKIKEKWQLIKSKTSLIIKKVKYVIIKVFYKYELIIVSVLIIITIIVGIILGLRLFNR